MDATHTPDLTGSASSADATAREGLRNLFVGEALAESDQSVDGSQTIDASEVIDIPPPVITPVISDTVSVEAEKTSSPKTTVVEAPSAQAPAGNVSRGDLVNVLESFVSLIKNTPDERQNKLMAMQNPISFDPVEAQTQKVTVHLDDKTTEVEELRCLLVEAQETIIRLLTDRVEDRARISQLETELKLLPDLQTQADRAMAAALNTEDFRKELTKVKFELERVRLARVRRDISRDKRTWWMGMRGWLFKTPNQ